MAPIQSLKAEELEALDPDHVQWCRDVIEEGCALEQIDLETLATEAPLIHAQLTEEAEDDDETIEQYLSDYENGLTGYIDCLKEWCHDELFKAERRPEVLAVAERVRAERLILRQHERDLLSRYQTTLDNQLYKALRAYRQAQDWRLKTLDGVPNERGMDAGEAA